MTDAPTRETRSQSGFDLTPPTAAERARLEASLSDEERDVLLHHGTEAPFCGGLLANKEAGVYCCRLCGLPLFRSGPSSRAAPAGRASMRRSTRTTWSACAT